MPDITKMLPYLFSGAMLATVATAGVLVHAVDEPARAGQAKAPASPRVVVLATGGTISQDMNDASRLELAARTNATLARPDVAGVVITHGTDTMEETAYFLDLVVKSDKPVVLVGSMSPATVISADGPGNLYDAVTVATSPDANGRGVAVMLDDKSHAARNESMARRHTTKTEFDVSGARALPRVDVVDAYANMDPSLVQAAIQNGAKGVVVAGVGDGNMPKPVIDALAGAVKNGVVVVRTTRLERGLVLRNGEADDDKLGFVASGELNPAKARVLTQLALTKTTDPKAVQRMFDEY